MNTVDARGRACPEPVMMVRAALSKDASGVEVLVDDICAVENIRRYATNSGYAFASECDGSEYKLSVTKK